MNEQYKERISSLFRFAKDLNDLRNPVIRDVDEQLWTLWLDDLPEHSTIKKYSISYDIDEETDEKSFNINNNRILKVKRPELTEAPIPPKTIINWLKKGWENLNDAVEVLQEMKIENRDYNKESDPPENRYIIIKFNDDNERVKDFKVWNEARELWIKKEKPARLAMDVYNDLYRLHSRIKKESETVELVLGDGLMYWNLNNRIHHPILLQKIKLIFNANIPEFILEFNDCGSELYTALLRTVNEIDFEGVKYSVDELEKGNFNPLEICNTNGFLKRLAVSLTAEGTFLNTNAIDFSSQKLQIRRRPVVYLRKRNLGYNTAIDAILEDIPNNDNIPSFVSDIIGYNSNNTCNSESELVHDTNPNGEDEEILLTKPANSEQLLVAKQLERNGAVLVQGPPGTGKTHTIANLIGHLLSEGKSILVTSYSEKALSVLKEKVETELQPLCLSLLSSVESKKEMEKTLDALNDKRSRLDVKELSIKINELTKSRKEILNKLKDKRMELRNARENEYRPIIYAGEEIYPSDAAIFVRESQGEHNWIPKPVHIGKCLPFSLEEFNSLYSSNVQIIKSEEIECNLNLPDISRLLKPEEYYNLLSEKHKLSTDDLKSFEKYWNQNNINYSIVDLKNLVNKLDIALKSLNKNEKWVLETLQAGKQEEQVKQQWLKLVEEIKNVYNISIGIQDSLYEFGPEVTDDIVTDDNEEEIKKIIEHLSQNKKINPFKLMFNSKWKTIIKQCKVNEREPEKLHDFNAILDLIKLQKARNKLKNRWNRQIGNLGAPKAEEIGENFECTCIKYCDIIEKNLNWYEHEWKPIENTFKKYNFKLDNVYSCYNVTQSNNSDILKIKNSVSKDLVKAINSQINKIKYNEITNKLLENQHLINGYLNQNSKLVSDLYTSVKSEDSKMYKETFNELCRLNKLKIINNKRKDLINRLKGVAPTWADEINQRIGIHGESKLPGDVQKAWKWRQFNDELDYRNNVSMEEIQQEILSLEKELKSKTIHLAQSKSWKSKLESMTKQQIQAIEGWRQTIESIGGGKGKRVPMLLAQARKLMPTCQSAVPVWIMPLNKVAENFDPKKNKFDVVIIDEASQADVMAMIALYLGKKVVIVGDKEQVSPVAVGQKIEEVENLIKTHLTGIPNNHLYTGSFSIYDIAQTTGYQPVCLREHFRCVPDIIQYSNRLSYDYKIKPLRDTSNLKCTPFTIAYRVENTKVNSKVNKKEAKTIASLIMSCLEQPEYKDKTFGIITLLGDRQAAVIEEILQNKLQPSEYEARKIQCGNSANFQGDERDVIFLSMVDTNDEHGPLTLRGYGKDEMYKKRYNVAVSRACEQLWLVYSLDPENDLKEGDIRKDLINYVKNPKSYGELYDNLSKQTDSEFENMVLKRLIDKGYNVKPQWKVGSYRIDMVVEYRGKRLAIECDGERWHRAEDLEHDMNRQAILERLGWRFERIRGSEFFRNSDVAMKKVFDKLNKLQILPNENTNDSDNLTEEFELKSRVIRRAEDILDEWNGIKNIEDIKDEDNIKYIGDDVKEITVENIMLDEVKNMKQIVINKKVDKNQISIFD